MINKHGRNGCNSRRGKQKNRSGKMSANPFPHPEFGPTNHSSLLTCMFVCRSQKPYINLLSAPCWYRAVLRMIRWRALLMERTMEAERSRINQSPIRWRRDVVSCIKRWLSHTDMNVNELTSLKSCKVPSCYCSFH